VWDNHGVFEVSLGQIVAGKYCIDGVMGSGGMGVVVAATHLELDQRVAIKFLREVSPDALARFQREARLLVRLKSSHVARIFDVGTLDDETPYIVMEHLDGDDLATVISARKKLPLSEAVDYVLQACEAVAEAHALGMVHRDLKPANLFLALGPGGTKTVKVLDFGVSKVRGDRASSPGDPPRGGDLTHEGMSLGSPGYMSPEQITSARDVDERSDIFSLGALLYRLVAGTTPYRGKNAVSILASMATEGLTPVRTLAPEVPDAFAATVERCLAQDKSARFPTVAHLAHALAPYAERRGRLMIEQILATLNVTFDDDALDATAAKSAKEPPEPAKPVPPKPRALPLPQIALIVIATVVVVVAGSATCRALKGAPEPAASASAAPVASPRAPAATAVAATAAAAQTPVATEPTTAPPAPPLDPAPTSRPKMTPTPLARPRGKR
jgi:serine/threonine-protein kinase